MALVFQILKILHMVKNYKGSPDKKKRKAVFRSTKRNSAKKKHLANISKKASREKRTWTSVVDWRMKRYFDSAFDTKAAFNTHHVLGNHLLRLTASRVYKTFLPRLLYNDNVQYAHKDICIAAEDDALDLFMEGKRGALFRPGTIVHPKYFFMSCIPDALIKTRTEVQLVEVKTKLDDEEFTADKEVRTDFATLLQRWEHQIQFSLHVCDLKKGFLVIYDFAKKSIEVTKYARDEKYMEKHLNRFVNYFVDKIFTISYDIRSREDSLKERGRGKLIRQVWDQMSTNETCLHDLDAEGKNHFKILYNSLPFAEWM